MKKILIILALIIGVSMTNTTQASHIVGGDVSFTQTGPNTYKVTMRFFRFCTGISTPTSASFRVYDNVTNAQLSTFVVNRDSIVQLSFGDDCYTPPGLCVRVSYYSATITLPNNPNGYYTSYATGGRNSGLKNLVSGSSTWTCQIPDPALTGGNSNPVFVRYPSDGYFCIGVDKSIDFSCTDADGDSLVYSLETPYNSGTTRPFPLATYNATFNNPNFLGPGSSISIDPATGIVTGRPAQLGTYVLAVKCEEYRNGVKIGDVFRDLQYVALNCNTNILPSFEPRRKLETYTFDGDGCFDIVAREQDAEDTILIQITSNAFAYGAVATLPTANSTGRYDFSWVTPSGVLDTINNLTEKQLSPSKFEGIGSLGIRFCWNVDNCEVLAIDTFKVNVYGFSVGCDGSIDSVEAEYNVVIEKPTYSHNVPNVFSPNGDGKNDVFELKKDQFDRCFDALTIRIYNRWGQNVYESDDAKFEWDGRDENGNELTEGTYYVVLQGYYGGTEVTNNFPITLFR